MFAAPNTFFTAVGKLTTVTFTSNGTWTAPANVSLVPTISGKGSDGVSDSTRFQYLQTAFVYRASVSANPITATWQDYITQAAIKINNMNAGAPGVYSIDLPNYVNNGVFIGVGDVGVQSFESPPTITVTYVRGSAAASSVNFPPTGVPASNVITYAQAVASGSQYAITFTAYDYGYAGTDATGLGKTFPGGAYVAPDGYPATTTTFTNVTVTPSTSYSIVVPSGGTVSISYYA
jgi:hypothetical protein